MSELGQNGYLQQISQINSNVASFRGLQQEAREKQQELDISAKSENDLDDIRKIGSGFSEKAFKDLVGKYGKNLYTSNFGKGRSLQDLDKSFGKKLGLTAENDADSFTKVVGKGVDKAGSMISKGIDNLKSSIGSGSTDNATSFANRLRLNADANEVEMFGGHSGNGSVADEGNIKDGLNNISEADEGKYGSFLDEVSPSVEPAQTRITPIEELVEPPPEEPPLERFNIMDNVNKQLGMGEHDPEDLGKALDDNISPEEFEEHLKNKYNFGGEAEEGAEGAGEGAGEAVGEAVGEGVGEEAGAEIAGTALEGAGTALEATGVLAPLGFLFQAIGVGADIYAGVEAGKGVADAFENDVLGHQTYTAPKVSMPSKPNTLLSRNLLITPTSDTLHQQGSSFASGW